MSDYSETDPDEEALIRLYSSILVVENPEILVELSDGAVVLSEDGTTPVRSVKSGDSWIPSIASFPVLILLDGGQEIPAGEEMRPSPRARARRTDPGTSHEAADSISSDKIRASQDAVWRFLRRHGPMTDEGLVLRYDGAPRQSPSGLRTRRKELVRKGMVFDTGRRYTTNSGRRAIVWSAKEA